MTVYRIDPSYEGREYFELFIDFNVVYKSKEVAKKNLIEGIKEGFRKQPDLWEDVADTKKEAMNWWLENHFEHIEAVEVK